MRTKTPTLWEKRNRTRLDAMDAVRAFVGKNPASRAANMALLASKIPTHPSTVARWLNGGSPPSTFVAQRILAVLKVAS
jgi:hypothetical protein